MKISKFENSKNQHCKKGSLPTNIDEKIQRIKSIVMNPRGSFPLGLFINLKKYKT